MDNKEFNFEIRRNIRPILKDVGFDRFESRYSWRHKNGVIDCINFQSPYSNWVRSALMDIATYSFQVELGICFYHIPHYPSRYSKKGEVLLPKIYECHQRRFIYDPMRQSLGEEARLWKITPEGSNLEAILKLVRSEINNQAIAWFDHYGTYETFLDLLENDNDVYDPEVGSGYGSINSKTRLYYSGYTSKYLGIFNKSINYLESYIEEDRKLYIKNLGLGTDEDTLKMIKKDISEMKTVVE